MDEDRSATTHDPAARLGPATDVPDGIERLGADAGATGPLATARPTAAAWPTRWGGDESGTVGDAAIRDAAIREAGAGEPAVESPGGGPGSAAGRQAEPGVLEANGGVDLEDEDEGRGDAGDGHADEHDPPPRWAARPELRITPRSAVGTAAGKEDEAPPAPSGPGRRSTYWAVAVLVAFGVIAAVGLIRGGGTDQAATDDPGPAPAERSEASGSGTAGEGEGDGDAATSTATTAPATRPPDVGECALVDTSTPPGQYVHVPCEDARATLQLTQKVPAPAPPGSHCPAGTDSVTQVSDEPISGGAAVSEYWCLRNMHPPHPGDPGGGSGELVVGDCLGVAPSSQSIEVPCDGSGLPPEFVVGWLPDAAGNCPAEADASINLEVPFPARYCLRYA
jgi:hypothetical protein